MRQYEKGDQVVEDHWLLRRLGRGSFGEVWQARTGAGTLKAIKIVDLTKPGANKEETALQIMTQVRHPNICGIDNFWFKDRDGRVLQRHGPSQGELESSISEGDTAEGRASPETETLVFAGSSPRVEQASAEDEERVELIIAMQLCEGSLKDVLLAEQRRGGFLSRDTVLRYVAEAARAIDYVNATHGIQHRDIKPENLLVLADIVMVADFGLAKDILRSSSQTQLAMTPHYAAPEQSRGEVFATTDQYALAITYVHLLTGHLPYKSDSRTEVDLYQAKVKGELLLQDLPEHDRRVIRRATSPDPKRRYASCIEMVDALRSGPTAGVPWPKVQWRTVYTFAAAVAAVALLIFMGLNAAGLKQQAEAYWQAAVAWVQGGAKTPVPTEPKPVEVEPPPLSLAERLPQLCDDLQQRPLLLALRDADDLLHTAQPLETEQLAQLRGALATRATRWRADSPEDGLRKDIEAISDFNRVAAFQADLPPRVAAWRAHLTAWEWAMKPDEARLQELIPAICDFAASRAAEETAGDDLLWSLSVLHSENSSLPADAPPSAAPSVPAVFHFARWKQSLLERDDAVAALDALSALDAAPHCPWTASDQARRLAAPLLTRLTDRLLRLSPARPWRDMDDATRQQLSDIVQVGARVMSPEVAGYLRALCEFQPNAAGPLVAAREKLTWALDDATYLDGWSLIRQDAPTLADLAALARWRAAHRLQADDRYRQFLINALQQTGEVAADGNGGAHDGDLEHLLAELTNRELGWTSSNIKVALGALRARYPANLALLRQCGLRLLDADSEDDRASLEEIGQQIGALQPDDPLGALFRGEVRLLQAREGRCRVAAEVFHELEAAKKDLQAALAGLSDANLKGRCAAYLSGVYLHEAGLNGHTWSDYPTLQEAARVAGEHEYPERPFELHNARGNALEDMGRCFLERNASGQATSGIERERNRQQALKCFADAEACFQKAGGVFADNRLLQQFSKEVAPAEINCARIRIRQLELQDSLSLGARRTLDELERTLMQSSAKSVRPVWQAQANYWLARLRRIKAAIPEMDPTERESLWQQALDGYEQTAKLDAAYGVSALWERGVLLDLVRREMRGDAAQAAAQLLEWQRARCDNFKRFLLLSCDLNDYRLPLALEEWCSSLAVLAAQPAWEREAADFQAYLRRLASGGRSDLAALYQDRVYVWTAGELLLLSEEQLKENGRPKLLEQLQLRLWNPSTNTSPAGERLSRFIEQQKQPRPLAIATLAKLALLAASEELLVTEDTPLATAFSQFELRIQLSDRFRDLMTASQQLRAPGVSRDPRTVRHLMAAQLDALAYFIYKAHGLVTVGAEPEAWQVDATLYRDLFQEVEALLRYCDNADDEDYNRIHAEWRNSLKTPREYRENPKFFGEPSASADTTT